MGWRGVLRSAIAASRATERDRQRRTNAASRAHDRIDRIVDSLETETERDLDKLRRLEEKIHAKPISASGIQYDPETRRWAFKQLGDNTGQLKWTLNLALTSDAISADSPIIDAGRTYELLAASATRWAVFAAFKVSTNIANGRATKLFNKTNPLANKVLLTSNGVSHRALEGQLDLELPIPGNGIAIIAFPLPDQQITTLTIDFLFKSGSARMTLKVESQTIFTEAAKTASLLEMTRSKISTHTDPIRENARNAKLDIDGSHSSNTGWLWLIVLIGFIVFIAAIS